MPNDPDSLKMLAVIMAANCVRNTCIETYHAAGKLSDAEMMAFNKEVANRIYTFLSLLLAGPRDEWDAFLGERASMSANELRTWDKPEFLDEMWPGRGCLGLPDPRFSPEQGKFMAHILVDTNIKKRAPTEADLQRLFKMSPESLHNMVADLENKRLVRRTPEGTIEVLLPRGELPRIASTMI